MVERFLISVLWIVVLVSCTVTSVGIVCGNHYSSIIGSSTMYSSILPPPDLRIPMTVLFWVLEDRLSIFKNKLQILRCLCFSTPKPIVIFCASTKPINTNDRGRRRIDWVSCTARLNSQPGITQA